MDVPQARPPLEVYVDDGNPGTRDPLPAGLTVISTSSEASKEHKYLSVNHDGVPSPSGSLVRLGQAFQDTPNSTGESTPVDQDHHRDLHAHFDLPPGEPADHDDEEGAHGAHPSVGVVGEHMVPKDRPTLGEKKSVVDIEHVPVDDDPRQWSNTKKTIVLYMVSTAALAPTLGASIYNPAFNQLRDQLHATDTQLALSVSLFILFQGGWPVMWSSVAEVIGRKFIYLVSYACFIVGSTVGGRSHSMTLLMRLLQAFGSAAVLSIGAGSLADMYERHERGSKMGLYYGIPLLGPSLGPLLGGVLTNAFDWRATFYLIAAFGGVSFVSFIFFPDSWRKERSQLYQTAVRRSIQRSLAKQESEDRKRQKKIARGLSSSATTPATTVPPSAARTGHHTPVETPYMEKTVADAERLNANDVEAGVGISSGRERKVKRWWPFNRKTAKSKDDEHLEVHLAISDVNPLPAMYQILKRPNNLLAVICSATLFATQYTIAFTAAVTFAEAPYNYSPLKIGFVLLSFGGGNVLGSLLGGRYSDYILRRMKQKNGGISEPEMRLKSTTSAMLVMVPSFLVYAWTCQEKTNIAGPIVALFFAGFSLMVIYASTLAYLVDSNPGRSSSAIACNSFARGSFGCVTSQVALPIRSAIGDGGLYTILSGCLVLSCLGFLIIIKKGKTWRDPDWRWPWLGKKAS